MSEMSVTCFTDLKGSTSMNQAMGGENFGPFRAEHLRVGKTLAQASGGEYIKSIGDAHMITFRELEAAFHFATWLQELHQASPCRSGSPLQIRIGLFLGTVEPTGTDVFGSGVDQASRVEGQAPPGEVWVNSMLVNSIREQWGAAKTERYLHSKGSFALKGVTNPPQQDLFSFDWRTYGRENSSHSLVHVTFEHINDANCIFANVTEEDLAIPATVVWPVVPRDLVNAIHRGQVQLLRLLAGLGWKIHILVADCGSRENPPKEYSQRFAEQLTEYLQKRGVVKCEVLYMSNLYTAGSTRCDILHGVLQTVISSLTLNDLLQINQKDYDTSRYEVVKRSATLDFLRPALTIAAVLRVAKDLDGKSIVVVGHDERIQWRRANDVPGYRTKIGVLYSPLLTCKEGHQFVQEKNAPFWDNVADIRDEFGRSNLADWILRFQALLEVFPGKLVTIGSQEIGPADRKSDGFGASVDQDVLARHILKLMHQ